jgi:hypothetical protein
VPQAIYAGLVDLVKEWKEGRAVRSTPPSLVERCVETLIVKGAEDAIAAAEIAAALGGDVRLQCFLKVRPSSLGVQSSYRKWPGLS